MRQSRHLYGEGGPPPVTGTPVGHFMGMLNALLVPLLQHRPVNVVGVWGPGEVLRMMTEEGPGGERGRHLLPHQPPRPPRPHARAPGVDTLLRAGRLFPSTASGKVQKFRLRRMLRDGQLPARPG